jgi:hypothetical protein
MRRHHIFREAIRWVVFVQAATSAGLRIVLNRLFILFLRVAEVNLSKMKKDDVV